MWLGCRAIGEDPGWMLVGLASILAAQLHSAHLLSPCLGDINLLEVGFSSLGMMFPEYDCKR
jgi:hypothetical protein